ncbi:MAG TPA: alkaline phosphatase family protein [Acidimicrobiia bacterium]|nr:alkaline phosphatase family protein [Acidimicrobiia bacterium]
MRRTRSLLLVICALVVAVAACGPIGGGPPPTTTTSSTGATTTTSSTTSTTEEPTTTTSTTDVTTTTTTAPAAAGPCTGATPPAQYEHVIVVVMENKHATDVIGNAAAPWMTAKVAQCGTATQYAQEGSPSRPNYIALTSGTTGGCTGSNADPGTDACAPPSPSLLAQVLQAGGTVQSYAESAPVNCATTSTGLYAAKHNPWTYYTAEVADCAQHDIAVPEGFALDVANLPTLTFVTPDLCDDTHNCDVATGDAFLARLLDPVLASDAYLAGTTAVVVVYDEYTDLPNVVIAPSVAPGSHFDGAFDHYGMLRTIEDMLGLPPLNAAATAPSLRGAPLGL